MPFQLQSNNETALHRLAFTNHSALNLTELSMQESNPGCMESSCKLVTPVVWSLQTTGFSAE
jgi:hypothetical protein